jgi:hypothetical protein
LRRCATSRKFASSIPHGVIFHWNNPSGPTMVLDFTQPLTEFSTMVISQVPRHWGILQSLTDCCYAARSRKTLFIARNIRPTFKSLEGRLS